MSAGSYGTDPGQPGPIPEAGWTPQYPPPPGQPQYPPPPGQPQYPQAGPYAQAGQPQYPQPGTYGHPVSPQFQLDYANPAPPVLMPRPTNSLAVAALCCGIGQLVAGPLTGIPAIILGAMSLKQIRETGEGGHGMAVAGLVLGIVGTLLMVLFFVLVTAIFSSLAHSGTPPPGFPSGN